MDVSISLAGLVLLAPFLALVALAIKLDSRGPAFFRQVRMGARDQTFRIAKFRTMEVDAESRRGELAHLNVHARGGDTRMFKVKDDPRMTRVGRVLRRYSLDELPQLWNVLKGEMSLVGPRPLPLEEDQHVGSWARRRLDLRPGITGPWQVLGRSDIPFEEMVKLDYLYVTGWSLGHDLKLLARTIPVLFSVRGAY
jgi:lipopolysaccharide/colanic/teichoic acid biosynthesis glycosyltransferase